MAYYFLINKQTNVVDNYIVWNGDNDWQPPETHFIVPSETTKAIDWVWDESISDWVAVEGIGNGGIGDVWDGEKVSQIKPEAPNPMPQPTTTGTQEL